jgi:predicted DNA-binding transcriptional regulator AlpA
MSSSSIAVLANAAVSGTTSDVATEPKRVPDRLLHSPHETEILLGVSHAQVYRLIRAGRLVAVKIGARTGITRASIEAVASGDAQ